MSLFIFGGGGGGGGIRGEREERGEVEISGGRYHHLLS